MELPEVGRGVGEAEKVAGFEVDVPLKVLPGGGGIPPSAGQGEGTAEPGDTAAVGAGEEGEGMGALVLPFKGDGDLERRTEAVERGEEFDGRRGCGGW